MYTARAVVVLGEKADPNGPAAADAKSGGDRTRLNMISVFQKDPEFTTNAIRDAIAEQTHMAASQRHVWPKTNQPVQYHFDPELRGKALDDFCKRAAQAVTLTQKDGVVEIACRWPDARAADIVNAFYWAFHDEIVNYETTGSKLQETLLSKLLDDYKATEARLDEKLSRFGRDHADDTPGDSSGVANRYLAMLTANAELQANILQLRKRREASAEQLKTIPPKIKSMEIIGRATDTPLYLAAIQKRNEAQQRLDTLKAKYQDKHPMVQEAQAAFSAADEQFRKAEKASSATPNVEKQTMISNPEYDRLLAFINQADADLKGMEAAWDLKHKQAAEEKKRVLAAGNYSNELKQLTDQRASVRAARANVESQLETAGLAQKQDVLRASLQTGMLAKPVAEQDAAAVTAFMTYAAGPILGLLIAFALSLFAKGMDRTLRTPHDVEKRLGKPVLAVLPKMDTPRISRTRLGSGDSGQSRLPSG